MIEPRPRRPAAVPRPKDYYRNFGRDPEPIAATPPPPPAAPKIRHYDLATGRPIAQPLPAEPLRVSRAEIEAALVGGFTYAPHKEQIINRIVLETSRMDQHSPSSDQSRAHQQTIMRELRLLGLYPV